MHLLDVNMIHLITYLFVNIDIYIICNTYTAPPFFGSLLQYTLNTTHINSQSYDCNKTLLNFTFFTKTSLKKY